MALRQLPLALLAALVVAAPASADTTTILEPPAKAPVTIPGSGLERGERLAGGQVLLRRVTQVRAGETRVVTLRCPAGTTHAGLGVFEAARKVGFAAVNRNYVGRRATRVRAFAAAAGTPRGTLLRSSIFALCEAT